MLAFAALYLIWGSTYLFIRFAIDSIPPFLMAGSRYFTAGLIMYAIARARGAKPRPPVTWRSSLIVGGFLLLGGNGGVTISEKYIDTGLAAVIVATVPIYIVLARLDYRCNTAPETAGFARTRGRIHWRRSSDGAIAFASQLTNPASGTRNVDLARRIVPLVGRFTLFA